MRISEISFGKKWGFSDSIILESDFQKYIFTKFYEELQVNGLKFNVFLSINVI